MSRLLPVLVALTACASEPPAKEARPFAEARTLPAQPRVAPETKDKQAVEVTCKAWTALVAESPDTPQSELVKKLHDRMRADIKAAGLPGDTATIAAISTSLAERKGPIFMDAVERYQLQEVCRDFPFVVERDALAITCESWRKVVAELPDADDAARTKALYSRMHDAFNEKGYARDVGVFGALHDAEPDDQVRMFTATVKAWGMEEQCAGFPLMAPEGPSGTQAEGAKGEVQAEAAE